MAYPFPLPPPPNFRVQSIEPDRIRLSWSDYPQSIKLTHNIKGFRLYKSANKDELGIRLLDEKSLTPTTFQCDIIGQGAGDLYYTLVAIEDSGYGEGKFGVEPYGQPYTCGFEFMPYNTRPYGSPVRGYGELPYGIEPYGY